MNVLVSQNKPCILPAGARTPARNTAVCKAQTRHEIISDVLKGVKQAALIATAAGVLSVVPSDNAMAAATRNTSYEEQLLSSIKSRTGKDGVLPSLTSSPAVEPIKVEKKKAPVAVPAKKTVSETPRPSIGGKTAPADAPTLKGFDAPKPAAAPAPAAAPVATAPVVAAPSESSGDNKNAIVLGGVVLVAVAGIAVAGGNNAEGGDASSAAAPAAAAPGVDPNVAEARAWIAAWKKKHGKA